MEEREEKAAAVAGALDVFSREGYASATMQAIAAAAGVTRRKLTYHYTDKRSLYRAALQQAGRNLVPPPEVLERSYAVPVEGMRRFIDALFHCFLRNPDAVRLVARENLDPVLGRGEAMEIEELAAVTLHIERLLLLGQDSGAFRPEVSADDILLMLCSLCMFRASNQHTALSLANVDMATQRNTEGMRRLTIDTVLAFLTSNIPPSGYDSYVEPLETPQKAEYDLNKGIY
ncbi:TetR family transcriptional regulator [Corynebacterium mayonis]|uniref:TetR family transcriptional regulator n=1 Tax=Corynebacterium mayonis TaxID=3062461 RepID=UPI00313FF83A